MESLKDKTDEELRDLMRASINNQHVPSSIYHKAKQELEFRASKHQTFSDINNSNISVNSKDTKQSITGTSPPSPKSPQKINDWFWWIMGQSIFAWYSNTSRFYSGKTY